MDSIVRELLSKSIKPDISVTELLRLALVIATKLDIIDFKNWIEQELNGYSDANDVPEYRKVKGNPIYYNHYHGWSPITSDDPKILDLLSTLPLPYPIATIEGFTKPDKQIVISYNSIMQTKLMKNMVAPSESALFASSTSMIRIVDAVRNNILKWSLDLEQQGILCDGISFSETGKQGAESMQPTYNIGNIIGSMNNSQVQQANSNSTQTLTNGMDMDEVNQFMDMLTSSLGNLKLQQEQLEEMYNDIKMINLQVASKNPKNIVVVECMKSIRTMLESTGGNLASGLLIPALCKLIGC